MKKQTYIATNIRSLVREAQLLYCMTKYDSQKLDNFAYSESLIGKYLHFPSR
jgi:hypothetical protein